MYKEPLENTEKNQEQQAANEFGLKINHDLLLEGLNSYDRIAINIRSRKLLSVLLNENPELREICDNSIHENEIHAAIQKLALQVLHRNPLALKFYKAEIFGRSAFHKLSQEEIAAIRILDYIDNSGRRLPDLNRQGELAENNPFKVLWLAARFGRGGAHPNFFIDMIELFRQLKGKNHYTRPSYETVKSWMDRHASGLDPEIAELRKINKERILDVIIRKIDKGEIQDKYYFFIPGLSYHDKLELAKKWWNEKRFHLRFAARDPQTLNLMLDNSLDTDTLEFLDIASRNDIPIFVNPYYLSLLLINPPEHLISADQAIRDYIFFSKELLDEFGNIVAWEKEDIVRPGVPNAAGWVLPSSHNIHRRYPEVAILIPDTVGRSCAGLCVSCQRMYDFQRGNLNFEMETLKPRETWWERLEVLMEYFEKDSQLCDILITGGDALMSSNKSLKRLLDSVYHMSCRKKQANISRPDGEKYAEISRIRLGTRLPAYLPMRINDELVSILAEFRQKAYDAGIRQFIIQTHFETAMEITPEAREAVSKLLSAGWVVTNQQVFTTAASRRGHTAKLRKTLNDIGVIPYYTFSVKGYMENYHNFATNARALQEQVEEKLYGKIPEEYIDELKHLHDDAPHMVERMKELRNNAKIPFLATDRNMLNLPGVGKSLTFRVIGITRHGRRILEFDHDLTRRHSPMIEKMGKVTIIESKPVNEYLNQLEEIGEDKTDYEGIFGYSIGFTEQRLPVFKYPKQENEFTEELTNFMDWE
jgi:lysine 2,3-aminomutase